MKNGVLGVVGGLGPLATAHFLEEIARLTAAPTEQDHVDMIIYNFPSIPDRTGFILGSNLRSPLPGLLWAGRALDREQVSAIAIPCVTAHYFLPELRDQLRVPILNALEATALHLKEQGIARAGLLATQGTIHTGILARALMDQGITPVIPGPERQQDVDYLIYQNIKKGLPGEMDRLHRAEEELKARGAEAIVLGCTELSLLSRQGPLGSGFLDTTQVLARQAILHCGKPLKKEFQSLLTGTN